MEKDEINNQDKLSTIQDSGHATSVRKLYLNKRASVLRESFTQNRHDIEHFVHDVESSSFNATKDELLFARLRDPLEQRLADRDPVGAGLHLLLGQFDLA